MPSSSLRSHLSVSLPQAGSLRCLIRESSGDLDYMIDPEFAEDQHIQTPLKRAIYSVAVKLHYNDKWASEDIAIFVTKKSSTYFLFEQAEKQGITLFKGENREVLLSRSSRMGSRAQITKNSCRRSRPKGRI